MKREGQERLLRAQLGVGIATSLLPPVSQTLLAPSNPGAGPRWSVVLVPETRAGRDQEVAWLMLATLLRNTDKKRGK